MAWLGIDREEYFLSPSLVMKVDDFGILNPLYVGVGWVILGLGRNIWYRVLQAKRVCSMLIIVKRYLLRDVRLFGGATDSAEGTCGRRWAAQCREADDG